MATYTVRPISDRRQGKHGNCTGWALDPDTDDVIECGCAEGGHA